MSASFSPSEVIVRRKKFAIIAFLTIFVNSIGVYGGAGSDSWRLFARETNGMLEKCAQRVSHSKQWESISKKYNIRTNYALNGMDLFLHTDAGQWYNKCNVVMFQETQSDGVR